MSIISLHKGWIPLYGREVKFENIDGKFAINFVNFQVFKTQVI